MFKHPPQDISFGFAVGVVTLGTLAMPGCGASLTQAETVQRVALCKLEAVKVLPADPMLVTPYDLADVVERLKACRELAEATPEAP
jgi:hypothetical protein